MQTLSAQSRPGGPLLALLGLLLILLLFVYWWPIQATADVASATVHTTPPPEVAIELSDTQLADLADAYDHGFDHPDPGKGDPCQRLRLLPYKKLAAWRRQFARRGFTMQKIKDILRHGRRENYVHPEKGTAYTKLFDAQGNWIVVDFVECIVWQVAPYNFK